MNTGQHAAAVILVGFMGAGKTTVGRALAERLGWQFIDLDDRIVARAGRSVPQIFSESGEAAFRELESQALRLLLSEIDDAPGQVVALGGGAFVQPRNRALLAACGVPVVWLDAPVDELANRCARHAPERPLARDPNQFRQLYEARRARYMEAEVHIDTSGKSIAEVADAIEAALYLPRRSPSAAERLG